MNISPVKPNEIFRSAVQLCCFVRPQILDGSVYDHVKGYLVSLCQAELEASHVVQDTFSFLLEKSSGVSGTRTHTCLRKKQHSDGTVASWEFDPSVKSSQIKSHGVHDDVCKDARHLAFRHGLGLHWTPLHG